VKSFLKSESIVCDVGCGQEGMLLVSIADHIKEGYGFDFNLKSDKHLKENIFLSKQDFVHCDKKFDVILLLAVIEHLRYPDSVETMLRAIFDKLNDRGIFIMTTPDKRAQWILELLAYKLHLINEEEIRDHKHYFDKNELLELMRKTGFHTTQHKHFQFGLNNLIVCCKE